MWPSFLAPADIWFGAWRHLLEPSLHQPEVNRNCPTAATTRSDRSTLYIANSKLFFKAKIAGIPIRRFEDSLLPHFTSGGQEQVILSGKDILFQRVRSILQPRKGQDCLLTRIGQNCAAIGVISGFLPAVRFHIAQRSSNPPAQPA